MSELNVFEQASRLGLRYETTKGSLTVEDLWTLPLTSTVNKPNLNDIALGLYKQVRETADIVSFVDDSAKPDAKVQLQFSIVKHIIDVKKAENAERAAAASKAALKQTLLAALERKQNNALETMTEEEIRQKLSEL